MLELSSVLPACCARATALPDYLVSVRAGTLPPGLSKWTSLRVLQLAGNFFTGQLPAAFFARSAFSSSAIIYVYLNNLTGPLPPIEHNCNLCSVKRTTPGSINSAVGMGMGMVLEPMRAGYGTPFAAYPPRQLALTLLCSCSPLSCTAKDSRFTRGSTVAVNNGSGWCLTLLLLLYGWTESV